MCLIIAIAFLTIFWQAGREISQFKKTGLKYAELRKLCGKSVKKKEPLDVFYKATTNDNGHYTDEWIVGKWTGEKFVIRFKSSKGTGVVRQLLEKKSGGENERTRVVDNKSVFNVDRLEFAD